MKAGVASITITPDEPMWLAGWAARREPASGTSMDLHAKALVLENSDGGRVVMVTADLIAIPRELARDVAARCGLPRERILFNASHTHAGPEVRSDKVPFFEIPPEYAEKIPPYVEALKEKMAAIIQTALGKLEPVTLRAARTSVDFAQNRRTPDGPMAHEVPVLQILRPDGKPLAVVFGYACHNLTLPSSFCQYHGDYAGAAQQWLEKHFPGATALFLAGAGADQDPHPRGSLELAMAHGETLARAIAQTLAEPGQVIEGKLGVAFEEVALDFLPLPSRQILEADANSNDPPRVRKAKYLLALKHSPAAYPCPVQVWRFGREILLVALGGEPVVDYALRLQTELAGPLVWVAGYCNDMFGYLPSRRVQAEGGYEGGRALLWSALPGPFTDTVEERIIDAVHRLASGMDSAGSRH